MKRILASLLVGLWLCTLVGCSEIKGGTGSDTEKPTEMEQSTIEEIFLDKKPEGGYPEKISAVKVEKFMVDAGKAKEVFLKGKKIEEQVESPDGSVSIITEDMHMVASMITGFTYTSLSSVYSAVMPSFHSYSEEEFSALSTGEDLEFASIQQANADIQQVFKELGIPQSQNFNCYSLKADDYVQRMEQLQKESGTWVEGESEVAALEQDCYFFYFRIPFNGILISDKDHGDFEKGSFSLGSFVAVIYTKDGIDTIQTFGLLDLAKAQNEDEKPLIAKEEAVNAVLEKLNAIVGDGEASIVSGSLEYIAKPDSSKPDSVVLTPCWLIELATEKQHEVDGERFQYTEYNVILIDALTGKELMF